MSISCLACLLTLALCPVNLLVAQPAVVPVVKYTREANRQQLYQNLNRSINRNLSMPLNDSTEAYWMDAFNAMELIRFQSPWAETQVRGAFNAIENRSLDFQRSLLELVFAMYPAHFFKQVTQLLQVTDNDKILAMCAEYLQRSGNVDLKKAVAAKVREKVLADTNSAILHLLNKRSSNETRQAIPPLVDLLQHSYFDTATVVFSFQRSNRNFPGLTVIRDRNRHFVRTETGNLFTVVQLARSINNLPGYLTNGNTPQGVFRMYGLDTSRSIFIGPTANIQLTMPFEASVQHFMQDSNLTDADWTLQWYKKLLPLSWSDYLPAMEAYYAGKAGRTEIIAHGTTVSPDYYAGQPYYPLTPTLGCLCTRELWSGLDGRRLVSDQQLLVDAIQQAGGANGYYIVVEIDDQEKPVTPDDLLPFIKLSSR